LSSRSQFYYELLKTKGVAMGDLSRSPSGDLDMQSLVERVTELEERLKLAAQEAPLPQYTNEKLAKVAAALYRARRRRDGYFAEDLFAEPAWDMLLDLFINRARGRCISTKSLCLAGAVPETTALRWIGALAKLDLISKSSPPEDRRLTLVEMTPLGFTKMRQYLSREITKIDVSTD
jgi:hypothetical protein